MFQYLAVIGIYLGIVSTQASEVNNEMLKAKINFDLTRISPEGLIGESDNLRSITFEFCIPANSEAVKEIKTISPALSYYANSPGRIGCRADQYLCLGDTHNPRWKEILLSIASLDYVTRIEQFWGE